MNERFSTAAPGGAPHADVGAYALGVLDEYDAARFEEHLIDCDVCAAELESLLPVVDVLSRVDPPSFVIAEQSQREGRVLQRMIGTVGRERRRARRRQLVSASLVVVIMAMVTSVSLFAGARWFDSSTGSVAAPSPSLGELLPTDQPGLGGPDVGGEQFSGSDPRTGVRALVSLEATAWGTQVSFGVSNITGPLTCRLLAVLTNGSTQVLSSWTVPEKGYGTAANPDPLLLQAATSLPRAQIAHVQVQAVGADGQVNTLVTVPE